MSLQIYLNCEHPSTASESKGTSPFCPAPLLTCAIAIPKAFISTAISFNVIIIEFRVEGSFSPKQWI